MDKLNLAKKISIMRTKIKICKDAENKFEKYKYFSNDAIFEKAKALFNEYGVFTIFSCRQENDKIVGSLKLINCDDYNDNFTYELPTIPHISYDRNGQPKGSPCQWAGATNTYLSKYLHMNVFMLTDSDEDPDSQEHISHPIDQNEINDLKVIFETCTESSEVMEIWKGLDEKYKPYLKDFVGKLGKDLKQREIANA